MATIEDYPFAQIKRSRQNALLVGGVCGVAGGIVSLKFVITSGWHLCAAEPGLNTDIGTLLLMSFLVGFVASAWQLLNLKYFERSFPGPEEPVVLDPTEQFATDLVKRIRSGNGNAV